MCDVYLMYFMYQFNVDADDKDIKLILATIRHRNVSHPLYIEGFAIPSGCSMT